MQEESDIWNGAIEGNVERTWYENGQIKTEEVWKDGMLKEERE